MFRGGASLCLSFGGEGRHRLFGGKVARGRIADAKRMHPPQIRRGAQQLTIMGLVRGVSSVG